MQVAGNAMRVLFSQDYENYKAIEKFPSLDDLPRQYEQQALQLVSTIENKDVQFLD